MSNVCKLRKSSCLIKLILLNIQSPSAGDRDPKAFGSRMRLTMCFVLSTLAMGTGMTGLGENFRAASRLICTRKVLIVPSNIEAR